MMADSIESATRVLQEPTPERVRGLVDGIVEGKREDGQLAEAPLTLGEISVLKDTFVKVLSGIYHHRIDYPSTQHLTDAPDTSGPTSEQDAKSAGPPGEAATDAVEEDVQMELGAVTEKGV
jgi:hypothetical protein